MDEQLFGMRASLPSEAGSELKFLPRLSSAVRQPLSAPRWRAYGAVVCENMMGDSRLVLGLPRELQAKVCSASAKLCGPM